MKWERKRWWVEKMAVYNVFQGVEGVCSPFEDCRWKRDR